MEISLCTAGTEERPSASTDSGRGNKNTQKAQGCPRRGLQQSSAPPIPPTHTHRGKDSPFSQQGKEDPISCPQLHPKPARILPAWEMGPGRGHAGPEASHTIPTRKHPRPQKKSQQPLGFLVFFCCCISYIIQFHILIGSAIIEQLILKSFNTSETAMVR